MNALQTYFPASTSFPPMLFGPTQNYFSRKGWCVQDKAQLWLFTKPVEVTEVTKAGNQSEVQRAELDWLFAPKVATLSDRAIAYLIQLEAHEVNPHVRANLRQSQITLILAQRGNIEPATVASYQVHCCHPDQVWPRRVAEREAKLGKEYPDWFDAAGNLRPDCPKKDSAATQTPLTADTGEGHPHRPVSAEPSPVPQTKKEGAA
jgi:hypothetical protein